MNIRLKHYSIIKNILWGTYSRKCLGVYTGLLIDCALRKVEFFMMAL